MNQYPSFICKKTPPYIFPTVELQFFLQDTGIEKPDYLYNPVFHSLMSLYFTV